MNKEILRLALPNIVSNITVPLLTLIDLTLMGHLEKESYIGAIALGGVLFNFIYWAFSFLRMGTCGLTGQAFGRDDMAEAFTLLTRSILIAFAVGLCLICLQVPIEALSFKLLEGSNEVKELARHYFRIRIWAAPATLGLYALTGWFVGMQNAKIPMTIAITINVVNILANMLFVFGFHMTSSGVALGTVLAQYAGLFMALYFIKRKFGYGIPLIKRKQIFNKQELLQFFTLNRDIFIRTLCVIFVFTFFTSKSAGFDDTILAVNSLLLQFMMFFSFFMDGFAYAGESISSKYFGRKDKAKLIQLTKNLFVWGIGLAVTYTILYGVFGKNILQLLTNNQKVLDASTPYLLWTALVPLLSFSAFVWDAVYIGCTASKGMRNTMLGATLLLFFPTWYFLTPSMGNHALWLALNLYLFGRGFFQTLLAKREVFSRV